MRNNYKYKKKKNYLSKKKKTLEEYYRIKVDIEQNTHPKHPQPITSFTKITNPQCLTLTSKSLLSLSLNIKCKPPFLGCS